jgi:uncharacterized protein (UPF0332 family)
LGKSCAARLLEKEWAMVLAHEQDERASADYDVELTFSQEVARQRVEESRSFLERICSFLKTEGLDEIIPAGSLLDLHKPNYRAIWLLG